MQTEDLVALVNHGIALKKENDALRTENATLLTELELYRSAARVKLNAEMLTPFKCYKCNHNYGPTEQSGKCVECD